MTGTLYLVATPIGNLGDSSARMAETLRVVDFIAAEDTRVTVKLLNHLGLKKPMVSYYRHNAGPSGDAVLGRILAGESCALVTDAGTPAISDPGEELVVLCAAHGVPVVSVPGPCALITALAVSGLPTGRFTFEGFLAMNKKNRRAHLEAIAHEERTMIFYEAPHKLSDTLCDLRDAFGQDRRIALCRELTKFHEEVHRTTLGQSADWYAQNTPKGEFVLVVEGASPQAPDTASPEEGLKRVEALRGGGASLRDAVRQTAAECSLSRKVLYELAVRSKEADCDNTSSNPFGTQHP
ncbi:MAG: 16S rRNA (cytidine(1402)-2'-O)-methyltransferase [Clostridia bacterium]|nr:16S rRNA (cytidine(1402)-2'-O)-methyltransferase [Clostridia bacterium]